MALPVGARREESASQTANATANRIDLSFGDWHDSAPRMTRGSLEERNILTRGDFTASGRGVAIAGGKTVDLYRNIAVLMPANLEFTLKNTREEPLMMYVVNEPASPGFRPNSEMLVPAHHREAPPAPGGQYRCGRGLAGLV